MERTPAKVNISMQLIVIIILVFFCGILFILKSGEKGRRVQVEKKLVEVIKAKEETQKSLNELKLSKTDLETKISNLETEMKKLSESLTKEKEEKNTLKSNLDAKEAILNDINSQLEREKSEKESLNDRLIKTQRDYDNIKSQFDQLSKTRDEMEIKLKELAESPMVKSSREGGIELEKIVVSADSKLKGDVVVVNKNLSFLVINLGSKNGITPGSILGIYRNESFIGEVQVEKVYDSICSANILPEWKNVNFKEGDKAVIME